MKIFTTIILVILFSAFCALSSAQQPFPNQLTTNNSELSIKLVETHTTCNSICDGKIATLIFGVGPFTYNWSNGSESSFISNLCAGIYSVVVKNKAGEIAKAAVDAINKKSVS